MFNRFVAILLILFTLTANFSKLFIYAGYHINKQLITNTICENRHKPWLHCNGKCYLVKKIRQAEEKEKNDEKKNGKSLFQDAFLFHRPVIGIAPVFVKVLYKSYPNFSLPQVSASIFQPPQSSVLI